MPDFFDPSMLVTDDWWDIPADYFSGGGMLDYSQLGGGLPDLTGGFDIPGGGIGAGGDQWFFDTQTGQVVTLAQAQHIDPMFRFTGMDPSVIGGTAGTGSYYDPGSGQWTSIPSAAEYGTTPPGASDWLTPRNIIGALTAAGGLGALGLGIGSLFGGNAPANQTTTQTSASGRTPMTPEMTALLGSGGGAAGGVAGAAGGPGTGLMGLSNTMIQNLMGSGQGGALGPPGGQEMAPPQQYGGLGAIGYAGGTPNFNESTGTYAPGTGPLWQQQNQGALGVVGDFGPGGNVIDDMTPGSPFYRGGQPQPLALPASGRTNLNAPFAPAVRQWNEATGQYDYNPGYGPSPGGGAMVVPHTKPLIAPGSPFYPGYGPSPGGGALAQGGGQQPQGGQWRETTGIQGQKMSPTFQPAGGGAMVVPQPNGLRDVRPQTWPAVPGSGGGYLSAPSGGESRVPATRWPLTPELGEIGIPRGHYEAMGRNAGGVPMTAQQLRALAQGGGQQPQGGQPQQVGGQGLIGQQSGLLGGLQGQIPQLNPAIMQALGMQAQGMSQGMLPALNDPQAQARIQGIYQPGFDALNYNSGLALSNAREQLQQRGFQAPDIREGPTQALTAPILAAQQLGRSQLYGQMAGAQLDLATRLPMLGSQLNAQNYATQIQPWQAGLNLAGAYNQPIQTQGQFPLSLLDILQRGQGSTQTVNTVGPQPSLTQQLGQIAPLVGAGGSLLSSAGNTLFPQQQNPYGFAYNPFTGASLSGAP